MRAVPPPSPRQTCRGTSEAGLEGDSLWCSEIPSISEFSRQQAGAPYAPIPSPIPARRALSPHCAEILADFPDVKGTGYSTLPLRFYAPQRSAPRAEPVLENVRGQGGSIVVLDPPVGTQSIEQESFARHPYLRGSPVRRPFTSGQVPTDDWCPPEVKATEAAPGRTRGHPAMPGRALRRCFSSVIASRSTSQQGMESPWRKGDSSRVPLVCNSESSSPIHFMRGAPHPPSWQASKGAKVKAAEPSCRMRRPESAPCISALVNRPQIRSKTAPTGACAKSTERMTQTRPEPVATPDAESGGADTHDGKANPELSRYCQAFATAVENFKGERYLQVLNSSTASLPSRRYALPPNGGIPFALKEPYPEAPRQGFLCSNISGINALLASRRSALSRSGILDAASKPGGA